MQDTASQISHRIIKQQILIKIRKNVKNMMFFYTAICGKLCGNCGKHSKIVFFAKSQTVVLVENFLHLITRLTFSMFLIFAKNHSIIQQINKIPSHFSCFQILIYPAPCSHKLGAIKSFAPLFQKRSPARHRDSPKRIK